MVTTIQSPFSVLKYVICNEFFRKWYFGETHLTFRNNKWKIMELLIHPSHRSWHFTFIVFFLALAVSRNKSPHLPENCTCICTCMYIIYMCKLVCGRGDEVSGIECLSAVRNGAETPVKASWHGTAITWLWEASLLIQFQEDWCSFDHVPFLKKKNIKNPIWNIRNKSEL